MQIAVVGGAGHVGLPTSVVLGNSGFDVHLIDVDEEKLNRISSGEYIYKEEGGSEALQQVIDAGRLHTTTSYDVISDCDVVLVVIGTPIDEHKNPQMDILLSVMEDIADRLTGDQLVTLRSTVYPGTTAIVRDKIERQGYTVGEDIYLSFAPERTAQHNAIEEIQQFPQLVGAFDDASYERTVDLYSSIVDAECLRLTATEAELGKLFTNMWRYLTFAVVNEFYYITDSFSTHHDVNVNRILDKTSENYPRFDVPSPGANVGGPCLTKDGWFLIDNIPYNELVSAAYQINEGMPANMVERMVNKNPSPKKITILGMTFKADSDDTRNSVSFKLQKLLRRKGYSNVVEIEPNCDGYDDIEDISGSDWVFLMTPHEEFADLSSIVEHVDNPDCLFCDVWGFWEEAKYASDNGLFYPNEIEVAIPPKH